jgi:DNA-binding NarL/FixJ family response regulator
MGVRALLTYNLLEDQFVRAIECVARGGFWVPRLVLSRFVDSIVAESRLKKTFATPIGLSRREKEIADAISENLSNKEIASKLNISEPTVKFHVSHVLAKFGVQRRSDLILLYASAAFHKGFAEKSAPAGTNR